MNKIPRVPLIDPVTGKDAVYNWQTKPVKDRADRIANLLPHGSGINGYWSVEEHDTYWTCRNSYDTMNEGGYYDYTVHFSLVIPKRNPQDFRLHFHGYQYPVQKYNLRDYLEFEFAQAIDEIFDRKGNVFA